MYFTEDAKNKESDNCMVFLKNRRAGAKETAAKSKEKGGDALLSYYHFAAKDQPYAEITKILKSEGLVAAKKFCKIQYKNLIKQIDLDAKQKEYQAIVGRIEVFGECYIKFDTSNWKTDSNVFNLLRYAPKVTNREISQERLNSYNQNKTVKP